MKSLLESIGLGDGLGNTSSTRVLLLIILLALLVPKVVISIRTGAPISFDDKDVYIIGFVITGGVAKTVAEGKVEAETTNPKP